MASPLPSPAALPGIPYLFVHLQEHRQALEIRGIGSVTSRRRAVFLGQLRNSEAVAATARSQSTKWSHKTSQQIVNNRSTRIRFSLPYYLHHTRTWDQRLHNTDTLFGDARVRVRINKALRNVQLRRGLHRRRSASLLCLAEGNGLRTLHERRILVRHSLFAYLPRCPEHISVRDRLRQAFMRRTIGYLIQVRHSLCKSSFPIPKTIANRFRLYRLSQVLPDASRFCKLSQMLPDSANYCKSLHDSEDYWKSLLNSINVKVLQ